MCKDVRDCSLCADCCFGFYNRVMIYLLKSLQCSIKSEDEVIDAHVMIGILRAKHRPLLQSTSCMATQSPIDRCHTMWHQLWDCVLHKIDLETHSVFRGRSYWMARWEHLPLRWSLPGVCQRDWLSPFLPTQPSTPLFPYAWQECGCL